MIKETYLLASSPSFQLSMGEEANINLSLERNVPDKKLVIIILLILFILLGFVSIMLLAIFVLTIINIGFILAIINVFK